MIAIEVFSGGGLFSTGMIKAGIDVKLAIDNWNVVSDTFTFNHPSVEFLLSDIRDIDPHMIARKYGKYRHELLFYGSPPCIEFSCANKNKDEDKGMELVKIFFEWVKILRPRYWIMENVPNIINWIKPLRKQIKIPRMMIFNSADFGVPQKRLRAFIGKFNVPLPSHSDTLAGNKTIYGKTLKKWRTVRDAIEDIMYHPPSKKSTIPNHDCYNLNLDANNPEYLGKFQGLKILDLDKPSPTVTDNHGNTNLLKINNELRRVSVREMARFQTIPDEFVIKASSLSKQYKIVGNGVPCLLAFKLGRALLNGKR